MKRFSSTIGAIFRGSVVWFAGGLAILIVIGTSTGTRSRSAMPTAPRAAPADTVTVEGRVVSVGSEPFTRLRLIEKGGGGYLLQFEETDRIKLRRQGPTEVRVVGIPFVGVWQGREIQHLRVVRWTLLN